MSTYDRAGTVETKSRTSTTSMLQFPSGSPPPDKTRRHTHTHTGTKTSFPFLAGCSIRWLLLVAACCSCTSPRLSLSLSDSRLTGSKRSIRPRENESRTTTSDTHVCVWRTNLFWLYFSVVDCRRGLDRIHWILSPRVSSSSVLSYGVTAVQSGVFLARQSQKKDARQFDGGESTSPGVGRPASHAVVALALHQQSPAAGSHEQRDGHGTTAATSSRATWTWTTTRL
jgi:hypothetical protein